MTDREPLQRSDHTGRKPQITAVGSLWAGPGCSDLARCNDSTYDERSEAAKMGGSRSKWASWTSMLSRSHGFVFIHIPKTGGNSIQVLLEPYSEDRRVRGLTQDYWNRFAIRGPMTSLKHQDLATYVDRLGTDVVASLKKVTFVRNPFDRAMSYYFSPHRWVETQAAELVVKTPHFDRDAFIKEISRLPPMVEYLRVGGEIVTMDFIGRFERFDADVARAMAFLGIDASDTRPPHVNRGMVEDASRFYDSTTLDFVKRRFAADFEIFGYRLTGPG